MAEARVFEAGDYRYIPAVFQYSSGVAAQPGYAIERARFAKALPLKEAYVAVERHLAAIGRPTAAFAACELRSPEPFTEQGFQDFNRVYVKTLERWGIYKDGERPSNPVARTNVCPMYDPPREPEMFAFSYTVPSKSSRGSFVIAGGGESRESGETGRARIVRLDDTSPEGLREKVTFVTDKMQQRLELLGFTWHDAVTTQVYTVQNIGHLVGEVIASRGGCAGGLVWTYARPPVIGLEYEMDVRGAAREIIL